MLNKANIFKVIDYVAKGIFIFGIYVFLRINFYILDRIDFNVDYYLYFGKGEFIDLNRFLYFYSFMMLSYIIIFLFIGKKIFQNTKLFEKYILLFILLFLGLFFTSFPILLGK